MTETTDLGQSRLDSLYVIADPIFDSLENALLDLEKLVGVQSQEKERSSELARKAQS